MKQRYDAGDPGGSLLFCASLSALTGSPGMQHYNASKGAMVGHVAGIAVEAGRYGIRCNVVCPGHTVSETVNLPDDHPLVDRVRRFNPMGRMGTPDDFEGIGVYFMSDWSRFHTGDRRDRRGRLDGERGQDRHLGAAAMAVKVLRVEGMRDDSRTPEERATLEAAEQRPLDMSVDVCSTPRREQTGLDDFGPLDFIERLDLLLDEVEADNNVWKPTRQRSWTSASRRRPTGC